MEVCFSVGYLHCSLSSIRVYSLRIDRQHLIYMNRQVILNITCDAEKIKQHTYIMYTCTHTHKLAPALEDSCTNLT